MGWWVVGSRCMGRKAIGIRLLRFTEPVIMTVKENNGEKISFVYFVEEFESIQIYLPPPECTRRPQKS